MMGNAKTVWCLILAIFLLSVTMVSADEIAGEDAKVLQAKVTSMPLVFIQNNGQFEDDVSYQTRSTDQVITVFENGMEFSQNPGNSSVFMLLDGSNPEKKIIGLNPLNGTANFYYGTDPSAWVTGATITSGVKYEDVYEGIDYTVSGTEELLKSEFILDAGADPDQIIVMYQGHSGLALNETTGDLIITTPAREIIDEAPVAYQEINGTKIDVKCSYVLGENSTVTFSLGDYDTSYPLVIDPVLRYSLYFGGDGRDQGNSIKVDKNGCAYFIGTSWSDHLKYFKNYDKDPLSNHHPPAVQAQSAGEISAEGLAPGSIQPYFGGGEKDAFVVKVNPDGTELIYITYIGGTGTDEGTGLVIDEEGYAYITGGTNSPNFPVKNAYRSNLAGGYDAWMAKLDPTGNELVYSTYFGGEHDDFGYDIDIDSSKNVFVTGQTASWNFPVVNRYQLSPYGGLPDAFITKFTSEGNSIVYSNFIGGSAFDAGTAVSVDANGYACIVGQTESPNFLTIKPFQDKLRGTFDAFVTKFDPEGKYPAMYSTYLGGSGSDDARDIITLPDGSLIVVGITKSKDFPMVNPIQGELKGLQDGFITTLNPDGSALTQSTYFGGSLIDSITGAARDLEGSIYVVGTTNSPDLPVTMAYQSKPGGSSDVMIAKLLPGITGIGYVTYLGGGSIDEGRAIDVLPEGEAYLTGYTESKNFPKVWPYQQNFGDGDRDAFIVSLSEHDIIPVPDFIGVPTEGDAPLTVQFTDKSHGVPTSWLWEFGDGETSTERNPLHVYQNPGTYTVSLTAKNIVSSQKATKPDYIKVYEPVKPPVADFSGNPTSGMVPLTVTFTDLSTNDPETWAWKFGDGATSAEKNPVHTYTEVGKFTVNLTVSNRAGTSSKEKPEYIYAQPAVIPPVADFNANPTSGMVPLTVTFTDASKNSPTAWKWFFGDNATSVEQNPVHTYTAVGTYSVTLNCSNSAGSDEITKPELIHAQPAVIPPVADFNANPTSGMVPLTVTFTDASKNGPTAWRWTFGDGGSSTEQNPVYTYANVGTFDVTLNCSNSAGSDQITKPEFIHAQPAVIVPVAKFVGEPRVGTAPLRVTFTDLSENNPTSWEWNFGDGATSIEQNPVHEYKSAGKYTVSLTVKNSAGSDTLIEQNYIIVNEPILPPTADFSGAPREGKAPLTVTFLDLSKNNPKQWYWKFGDGTTSEERNPVHTYAKEGKYTVELTVSNEGGADTKIVPDYIVVNPAGYPPDAQFRGYPTSGTAPLSVSFTDLSSGSPNQWQWEFGDGVTSQEQHPEHIYDKPGEYTVTLTAVNAFGMSTEIREKYIRVFEKPVPLKASFMGEPTSGKEPLTVQFTDLSAGNPETWMWNFGDEGTSTERNPVHVYQKAGTYTVFLTVTRGDDRSSEIRYNYITVLPAGKPPVPDFVASPTTGHLPLDVQFTDLSTDKPTAWRWDFGDGTSSSEQHPLHRYMTVGTYTVCLEASNEYGSAATCKDNLIRVTEAPLKPAEFFGDITIDGEPARLGSIVEARGSGIETGIFGNPVTTSIEGCYGTPDPLKVKGTIKNGEMITFWVKAPGMRDFVQADCYDVYSGKEWEKSFAFKAGSKTRLDLRVGEAPIPPMPVLPHEFYGEVTSNGMAMPVGTMIMVKGDNVVEGHRGNPLAVTSPGVYGFNELNKLVAQGDLKAGQSLTFWVIPAGSGEPIMAQVRDVDGGGEWAGSYPYIEGGLTRLDIRIEGGTPPIPVVPMTFSGTVLIDGKPITPGSMVTAEGKNVRVGIDGNPVSVGNNGKFGDGRKLTIQGEIETGTPITFLLYDAACGNQYVAELKDPKTGTWVQSIAFKPGADLQIELKNSGVIPAEKKNPSDIPNDTSEDTPIIAASVPDDNLVGIQ
ncbi:MAG: PKD domain-containing protein [Methanomicrobiales archaeon]|nr:PKD domain-containing protein [Methanomicrobiales archaeon]